MNTAEQFREELFEALGRLHDPDFEPSGLLCRRLGCNPAYGALGVQAALIHAIEALEPPVETPPSAHSRRVYELLRNRFILGLTREETAERLHISVSSVQRGQREAVHTLARILWEQGPQPAGRDQTLGGVTQEFTRSPAPQAGDWQAQAQRELAALRASAPDAVAQVEAVISSVLELTRPLLSTLGVDLQPAYMQPGLVASVHPTVLHQVLITAVERLARHLVGEMSIYARLEDGAVKITLTGTLDPWAPLDPEQLTRNVLAVEGLTTEIRTEDDQAFLWIQAPFMGQATVLVVDDNPDMARFYRRSTEGTRYRVVHLAEGRGLLEAVKANPPDAIVLDVMLPDVDGWRLLMRLREDPATRPIPVIICSVVREEALAASLGAATYLAKPVAAQDFIQALDRALPRA
jgi:CheY-like chemotaxis protein